MVNAVGGLVARHLALRFSGRLALLAAAVSLAALAVPADAWTLLPSPWVFGAPLSVCAGSWVRVRLRERGEDVAIAAAGLSPWAIAVPSAVLALAAQLTLAWPGRADPGVVRRDAPVQAVVGVDGSLLIVTGRATFRWRADAAAPDVLSAPPDDVVRLPPGFVPRPRDPRRLRRQLFAVGTPWAPTRHPLDPTALRWLWIVGGGVGVALALGARRPVGRVAAFAPLVTVASAL